MNCNSPVDHKLWDELKKRNTHLLIPHLVILVISYFVFNEMFQNSLLAFIPMGLILSSLLIRKAILILCFEELKRNIPGLINSYLSLVFLTGGGWGLFFWFVYRFYGNSYETLFCAGIIITIISGGVTAFASTLKVVSVYAASLTVIPAFLLFTDGSRESFLLGSLLCANLVYQIYHAYVSHHYLKTTISEEQSALSQVETLQEFIDAIPGLVTMIDKDGTHILVNNYANGFFKERALGKKVGSQFSESPVAQVILAFINSAKTDEVHELKSNYLGQDNWYMVYLKRISSPETGVIAVILPINELVKVKNDLRIQEARSQYASKLASLGELSAGIAHEVNNPLTIIEGAASLMKVLLTEKPLDESAIDKSATKIIDTTQRIARIIKSLRVLSKDAEEEPYQNISFASVIEPSLEISKNKLVQNDIKLSVLGDDSEIALFGNEIQLSQVVMNLVSNAIDAVLTNPGPRWIEIHYKPSYDWLDILIVDNGPGISNEIEDKIMDPFFTTKDTDQGTGLGLSISKKIIESHHGSLTYLSDAADTTFRIRLPRMNPWEGAKKSEEKEETDVVPG